MLRPVTRRAVRSPVFSGLVRLLEAVAGARPGLLHVLTYHRVDDHGREPDLDPRLISATPRDFDAQMSVLSRTCRVVTPVEVLRALDGGSALPPRAVLVTFDDGYEDLETVAWPILRHHRIPATLFVPTAHAAGETGGFWWDRLYRAVRRAESRARIEVAQTLYPLSNSRLRERALRAVSDHVRSLPAKEAAAEVDRVCEDLRCPRAPGRVLGWDALRRLASEGLSLAPHGRTHALMSRMSPDEAAAEATDSRRDLEREIGPTPPCFAYPGGEWSEGLPERLARAGFRLAFTTRRGVNALSGADPLLLRRINVGRTTSPALLRAQLLPCMRFFNRFFPLAASTSDLPSGPERRC